MKMYLPNELINKNYIYEIYDDYYQIKTNRDCYIQYNTTYCTCYRVFYKNNYALTNAYVCSTSSNQYTLQNVIWTDDWFYRYDMPVIILISCVFMFIFWYVIRIILKGVGLNA